MTIQNLTRVEPFDNAGHLDTIERLIAAYADARQYQMPPRVLDAISSAVVDAAACFKLAYVVISDPA